MSTLPPLYERWVSELLGASPPGEPRSTCEACAMVRPDPAPAEPGPHFLPELKCCMFMPKLPNFLVGRALLDPDPAGEPGRASLRRRLHEGDATSVKGLGLPREYADRYQAAMKEGAFGLDLSLRCPHWLDAGGGTCGIWRHRESVCTTWFCKHERGAKSRHFWHSLRQLLDAVEDALAAWCVERLDAREGWGRWAGREEAFYAACAREVEGLGWKDVTRIGGFALRFRVRMVKEAWRGLAERGVPPVLVPGAIRSTPLAGGGRRVWGYSAYDPIDLPAGVLELLSRFNGRPVEEVLADPGAGDGTALPPSLVFDEAMLERLFELRVLDLPPEA